MCIKSSDYICNLAAWQEPREDVLQLGLTVPCLCACSVCVVKVPMADWGHKAANATSLCHIFFHSASAPQPASLMLPFHVDIPCVCSTTLSCLAFLALSFFLEGTLKFFRTSGSCLLSAACPVFWSLSLFGKVDMELGFDRGFFAHFCLSGLAQWAVWAEILLADSVPTCNAWRNLLGFASSHRN